MSAYGDFYCSRKLGTNETITRGASNCPANWTVRNPTETWFLYKDGRTSLREVDGAITRSFLEAAIAEDGQQLTALSAADIGQDVTEIGPSCFLSCSNLRDLWLADGVSAIGQHAFMKCTTLSGLNWGTGLKAISAEAFRGNSASGGYKRIDMPDGLEALGSGAFMFNQKLSVVTVPSSVSYVGQNAFGNNSNLLSVVFHGKTMTEVSAMSDYPWGASGKIFVD